MYDQSQAALEAVREELQSSRGKFEELSAVYEATKQSELEEKSKTKQLERSIRALKVEKDQLYAQVFDLQERTNLQAKDLLEAQNQRKLAVQEFADVNEKVNELRAKNSRIAGEGERGSEAAGGVSEWECESAGEWEEWGSAKDTYKWVSGLLSVFGNVKLLFNFYC